MFTQDASYLPDTKCVRQACLDSMESTPTFVELPAPEIKPTDECSSVSTAAAVIRGANGITIELHENASLEFIKNLIGACTYAQ